MEAEQIAALQDAAEEYRARHDLPHGYVYFVETSTFTLRPCAWSAEPELRAFRPGVTFVHTMWSGVARILGPDTATLLSES